jgi:hypothetical protein
MKIRFFAALIILHIIIAVNLSAAKKMPKNTTNIDTPTAYTLNRGVYLLSITAYDNGGIEWKSFIGLTNFFYFGISLDIQNFIGKSNIRLNIPGVVAKLKIIRGNEHFPLSISIGYDSFYLGSYGTVENSVNELDRLVYGAYLVLSHPIYLFGSTQYLSYGYRLPMQPHFVPSDSSYFVAFDVPFTKEFRAKLEIEKVFWNFSSPEDWLYNLGLRYTYMRRFSIEFNLIFQYGEIPNRVLKIIYNDRF